ncbi:MAG: PD40 domain-containing protein [Deltaproteobacteria bacterium]|nr:PD40 domain-containing protein [Deltaproteobacteria bacterium]
MLTIASQIFSLALTAQLYLPTFSPRADWKTIETPHFIIHYDSKITEAADRLADRVEPVYQKITKNFQWEPSSKTHIVLSDFTDDANGLSTPIPYNTIYLYAAPPEDGSALDYYDDWLKTLITHEFTHTVHLDQVGGLNKIPRALLGRVWVPNGLQQQWAHEGLAMYEETYETTKGRGRSPAVKMFLRAVNKENKFIHIDRATYWNDQYPYGNSAYWYGIGFHQFLADQYGAQKIFDFSKANASSIVPSFFNFKTKEIYGKSFHRLWEEWREKEKSQWLKFQKETPSQFESRPYSRPLQENIQLLSAPAFNDKGDEVFLSVSDNGKNKILRARLNSKDNSPLEKIAEIATDSRLFYANDHLYYTKATPAPTTVALYAVYNDLWALDLKTKQEKQLTEGLRLRDPVIFKKNVYGVRIDGFKSSLIKFPLPESIKDKKAIDVLFKADGFDVISKPNISPDGKLLTFSMKVENKNRDLYLLNLETKKLTRLTNDGFEDHDPIFSANGNEIYFSSAKPMGPSKTLVPNLFALNLKTTQTTQLTDALTGIQLPAFSKTHSAFGYFKASGFEPQIAKISDLPKKLIKTESEKSVSASALEKTPKTLAHLKAKPYSVGSTLWPHYLLPFFFFTETNSAVGGVIGSHDPLNFHSWSAIGYQLFGPNRPGGAIEYSYRGFPLITLSLGSFAMITDYGNILAVPGENFYHRYYERDLGAVAGYSIPIYWNHRPTAFSLSQNLFFEKRSALLKWPTGVRSGKGTAAFTDGVTINNISFSPEEGKFWGISSKLSWSSGLRQSVEDFSPSGSTISFNLDYSPKALGSDFKILATTLSAKTYQKIAAAHALAFESNIGLQWEDPLYQRTYRLGGSLGASPISSVGRHSYSLRGLPASYFAGEGLVQGSAEYRYRLFNSLPGFGTAPLWFKNLQIALFSDGGQTYDWKSSPTLAQRFVEKFNWTRFTMTAGAELRSDISFAYAPPLTFRLGYGKAIYLVGQNVASEKVNETYFQIGASF